MTSFDLNRITRETIVEHIEYHETLDSTNELATELMSNLLPLCPALVLTANQTAGRGRGTNAWWATPGALTFSLVLNTRDLALPTRQLPLISLAAGLAVRHIVADLVPERSVTVKWPNDVLIGERKVCGILTKQQSTGGESLLIIGIGINVNNSLAAAPVDFRRNATSVFDVTSAVCDLSHVLIDLLTQIQRSVGDLHNGTATLLSELNEHNFLQGRNVTVQAVDVEYNGRCLGIDDAGALLLESPAGLQRLFAGTVVDWSS